MRICYTLLFLMTISLGHTQIELIRQSFYNTSLDSILDQLHRQYGLKYAYQTEDIQNVRTSWTYKGNNLNEALVQLFSPLELEYKIVREDLILIRDKFSVPDKERSYSYNISGQVFDGETGEPLPFANIELRGQQILYTDEEGRFQHSFSHREEQLPLAFSYLSYSKEEKQITPGQTDNLFIRLYPFTTNLEPIKVLAGNQVISRMEERRDVMQISPDFGYSNFGFNDPLVALQMLPGVANYQESGGLLNIRGGDDFDNYIVIDGLPLYKVDHFFGYFSAVSSDIVEDISIYKNAFPAQYGGKSSSLIDIRSREFQNEWAGSVSLGWLYSSAALEFPVSDNFKVFSAIRFNNANLANSYFSNLTEEMPAPGRSFLERNPNIVYSALHEPTFSFYDLYSKIEWDIGPSTSVFINFFIGRDEFENNLTQDYRWRGTSTRFRLTEVFQDRSEWRNTGLSFQVHQEWKPNFTTSFSVSASAHQAFSGVSYKIEKIAANNRSDSLSQLMTNSVSGLLIQLNNQYSIDRDHSLNFGLQLSGEGTKLLVSGASRSSLQRNNEGGIASLFYEYSGQIEKLTVTAGMRHDYYGNVSRLYHSPRLYMKYDWAKELYTKASWSIYQQFVRQIFHESPTGRSFSLWTLANNGVVPVLDRQHFMLGAGGYFGKLSADLEIYDIRSSGELEHALSLLGFDPATGRPRFDSSPLLYQGDGKTQGIELYLKWHAENWQPFLSYTLSKSTVSFDNINEGQAILAQNDRRHQLSMGLTYLVNNWEFQGQFHYASGRPYTNLSRYRNDTRDRRTLLSLREDRLPAYARMDISATYTFRVKNSTFRIKGSIFNLFNRENVKYYQYMYNIQQPDQNENFVLGFDQEMLGILPNLSLHWEF